MTESGESTLEQHLEDLIGEEVITDDISATSLADRCVSEAARHFTSISKAWEPVNVIDSSLLIESAPIKGVYNRSGVRLVRGTGLVEAPAESLFSHLVSRQGFQSIDEYMDRHRNLESFRWIGRDRESGVSLKLSRVEWKYPTKRREFVSLDLIDRESMLLVSKSVLSPLRPGGSRYQSHVSRDESTPYAADPNDKCGRPFVRAVQHYAARVVPISSDLCTLQMVTWGELCDRTPASLITLFNAHFFVPPIFARLRDHMSGGDGGRLESEDAMQTKHSPTDFMASLKHYVRSFPRLFWKGTTGSRREPPEA